MTFEQALAAMRRGEKVRRAAIDDSYIYIKDNEIFEDTKDHFNNRVNVKCDYFDAEHLMATDWVIVPAEVKQSCTKEHEWNGA